MSLKRLVLLSMAAALAFGSKTTEPGMERSQLLQLDRQFAAATASRGLEGYLSYLDESASVLPEGKAPMRGKEVIRQHYSRMFAKPDFRITWQPEESAALQKGVLGVTWGRYEATFRAKTGEIQVQRGRYTSVWRRQANGAWKVIAEISTPEMAGGPASDPCAPTGTEGGVYVIQKGTRPEALPVAAERCVI